MRRPFQLVEAFAQEFVAILIANLRPRRMLAEQNPRSRALIFAQQMGLIRIVTAKIKKPERFSIYFIMVAGPAESPLEKIPIANIAARIVRDFLRFLWSQND